MSESFAAFPSGGQGGAVPVIDIQALADASTSAAKASASALREAYETVGFAYIANHGVPEALIDAAFAAAADFHASSPERKRSLAINEFHRGYMGLATSTIVTSSVARNTRPNLSESLMLMHEVAADDSDYGKPLQGPNQWPDWLPGFQPTIAAYMAALEVVARRIVRGFALGLDLPVDFFDALFTKPTVFLRLLHYPPHPPQASADQFGAAPHTDYGCITILAQDDRGGLQVRNRHGEWLDAPPLDGTFVLNIGDIMPLWTNGRFVSTPHRVINRSGQERYSLPFFFDPNMDTVVQCLPTCLAGAEQPRFPPMRYGDYLMDRLNRNYDYRKAR